jgi:hypothetical protein
MLLVTSKTTSQSFHFVAFLPFAFLRLAVVVDDDDVARSASSSSSAAAILAHFASNAAMYRTRSTKRSATQRKQATNGMMRQKTQTTNRRHCVRVYHQSLRFWTRCVPESATLNPGCCRTLLSPRQLYCLLKFSRYKSHKSN